RPQPTKPMRTRPMTNPPPDGCLAPRLEAGPSSKLVIQNMLAIQNFLRQVGGAVAVVVRRLEAKGRMPQRQAAQPPGQLALVDDQLAQPGSVGVVGGGVAEDVEGELVGDAPEVDRAGLGDRQVE